ncbi:MAG: Do family serine endopeptidase [Verrucomicrobiales bacterium]|nr:MAG: Do family serine endopeptidase [Verrucomicrobiales bacterium]
MNVKLSSSIWVARRAGLLLGGFGLSCLAALTLCAKDAPKFSVSDRPVDRSVHGASYSSVIKRVQPSVVTIYSTRTALVQQLQQHHPFMDDPMFRQFFGDEGDASRRSRKRTEQSLGSGVIVSEDGYILTNNHVVDGADADGVKIALADGKTKLDAKVIGKDPRTDLAVLKVDGKKLSAITLADSDKIEVGDVVLAVGNPFGVGQSVSMGIVSAMGRGEMPFGHMAEYEDFIQTDAAINPGNSGGALVDAEGRLIGINQSIVSRSGGNAGVGFAIPVNLARSVLEGLSANGKMARGFLGVEMQPEITPELAKEFGLPDTSGVLVTDVVKESPAARAGVERDDVIVEFNGKKVSDRRHLRLVVSQIAPETKATLKVIRDGKEKMLNVTVGSQPQEMTGGATEEPTLQPADKSGAFLDGVEIVNLGRGARRQNGFPAEMRGVLVAKVDADSKAADAELRAGDVIVEINRRPVQSVDEATEIVGASKDGRVLLRVYSRAEGNGSTRYLSVETGKK